MYPGYSGPMEEETNQSYYEDYCLQPVTKGEFTKFMDNRVWDLGFTLPMDQFDINDQTPIAIIFHLYTERVDPDNAYDEYTRNIVTKIFLRRKDNVPYIAVIRSERTEFSAIHEIPAPAINLIPTYELDLSTQWSILHKRSRCRQIDRSYPKNLILYKLTEVYDLLQNGTPEEFLYALTYLYVQASVFRTKSYLKIRSVIHSLDRPDFDLDRALLIAQRTFQELTNTIGIPPKRPIWSGALMPF